MVSTKPGRRTRLESTVYAVFPLGTQATSALLEGFTVAVAAVLDAEYLARMGARAAG